MNSKAMRAMQEMRAQLQQYPETDEGRARRSACLRALPECDFVWPIAHSVADSVVLGETTFAETAEMARKLRASVTTLKSYR